MKKLIFLTISISIFSLALVFPLSSFAQVMMGIMIDENITAVENNNGHTAREEAEGKEVWEKIQAKELNCENLSDDDFKVLGEYFMGRMAGDSHEAMNNMIIQMMDEEGEEQMHTAMGKRMSGCEPNSPMPQSMDNGMMPRMMNMMMGGGMMNSGSNSWFGWGFMILFWAIIILAIVILIKWFLNYGKSEPKTKSAINIIEERYAKGDIDKSEFEKKKKDLS